MKSKLVNKSVFTVCLNFPILLNKDMGVGGGLDQSLAFFFKLFMPESQILKCYFPALFKCWVRVLYILWLLSTYLYMFSLLRDVEIALPICKTKHPMSGPPQSLALSVLIKQTCGIWASVCQVRQWEGSSSMNSRRHLLFGWPMSRTGRRRLLCDSSGVLSGISLQFTQTAREAE